MEVELSEKQKKLLKVFSMYLQSYGSPVSSREIYVESGGQYYISGWNGNDWYGSKSSISIPELEQITDLLIEIFDDYSDVILDDFEEDDNGNIACIIDSKERKLYFEASINKPDSNVDETTYSFDKITDPTVLEFLEEISKNNDYATVSYEGSGDSGYLEEDISTNNTGMLNMPENLRDILYRLIDSNYAGWENNEGGSGNFYFNFSKEILIHTHNEFYTNEVFEEIPLVFNF